MIKKAVVLCGGLATRFLPYCKSIPKEMLPVIDKPLIQEIVEDLVDAGIQDILIIIGRNKECLVNHFDRNVELEDRLTARGKTKELEIIKRTENLANITFKRQIVPRGTGHAVSMAKEWTNGEPFLMCFGDEMFVSKGKNAYKQILDEYDKHGNFVIATTEVEPSQVSLYGIVARHEDSKYYQIDRFVEKPNLQDAPSNIANAGPAVLDDRIFSYIDRCPEVNFEISITDAYNYAIEDGIMYGRMIDALHLDLGNKAGFVKSNIFMAMQNKELRQDIIDFVEKCKNELDK